MIIRVKNPQSDIDSNIIGEIRFSKVGDRTQALSILRNLPNPWINPITNLTVNQSQIDFNSEETLDNEDTLTHVVLMNLEVSIREIYGVDLDLEISNEIEDDTIDDGISNPTYAQASANNEVFEIFNVEFEDFMINSAYGNLEVLGREEDDTLSEYIESDFEGEDELPFKIDYTPEAGVDVSSVITNIDELDSPAVITQPKDGTLTISQNGLRMLMKHEGSRATVYDDKTGKSISTYTECRGFPTIGVGHLITKSEYNAFARYLSPNRMSENAIQSLLLKDLEVRIKELNRKLKVKVTQNQFDALLSLMFNTGAGNRYFKTALNQTNSGHFSAAAQTIRSGPKTSKGKVLAGLERRRIDESNLYLA